MPKAQSYPYWGCGGCLWHRTSVCSARYFCNWLPVASATGCMCLYQVQLRNCEVPKCFHYVLQQDVHCTKYFHLSLRLFVQNFLCARYKCTHAVSSCRQSKHFLFCRDSLNQNWLAVWFLGLGFLLSRTSGPPHFCLGLYCRLSLSKLKIYFSPSIKGRM